MKDFDFIPETFAGALIGSVRIPREIGDLKLWQRKPFTGGQAICDLYLLTNNAAGEHTLSGGMVVAYKPGWCLWSNKGLADRWGWRREEVERFMTELEKAEIISRHDIGQSRKVIVLTQYEQQDGSRSAADGQLNGQQNGTDGVGDRASEPEGVPPVNAVPVEKAVEHFTKNASGYTPEEIRAGWLALTARAVNGHWVTDFTKPPRPVADWRCALENEMGIRRKLYSEKKTARGAEARTDGEPPVPVKSVSLTLDEMRAALE